MRGCGQVEKTGRTFVFSDGTDTNDLFIPLYMFLPTGQFSEGRIDFEIISTTGNLGVERAVRTTNDRESFTGPSAFGTDGAETAAEWHYQSGMAAIDDTNREFQLGVWLKNTSGSGIEKGQIEWHITLRKA